MAMTQAIAGLKSHTPLFPIILTNRTSELLYGYAG